jgi:hypothetical protein
MVGVGGGRRLTPTNLVYVDVPRHSVWRRRRASFDLACWSNQRRSQRHRFQHWRTVAAQCFARFAPSLLRDGRERDDKDCAHCGDVVFVKQAGGGGRAMPVDGRFTWWFIGVGAIRPRLPLMKCSGWEGGTSWRVDHAKFVRRLDRVASSDGGVGQAVGVYFPPHAPEEHRAVWGIGWR